MISLFREIASLVIRLLEGDSSIKTYLTVMTWTFMSREIYESATEPSTSTYLLRSSRASLRDADSRISLVSMISIQSAALKNQARKVVINSIESSKYRYDQ